MVQREAVAHNFMALASMLLHWHAVEINLVVSKLRNLDSLSLIMHITLPLYQYGSHRRPKMLGASFIGQGMYIVYI